MCVLCTLCLCITYKDNDEQECCYVSLYPYVDSTITVIYTEKPSADFSAKTITKTAEGFFLDGVSVELVALG